LALVVWVWGMAVGMAITLCAAAGGFAQESQGLPSLGVNDIDSLVPAFRESIAGRNLKVRVVPSNEQVAAGQSLRVALVCDLADGWVYYSPDPGPVVVAGSLDVKAGPMTTEEVRWPADHVKQTDYGEGPVVNHVYTNHFVIYARLAVPAGVKPGEYAITVSPKGQICKDVCVNLDGDDSILASAKIRVAAAGTANPNWTDELDAGWASAMPASAIKASHASAGGAVVPVAAGPAASAVAGYTIWAGLGLALLAGLTLNIMPCVLPIIPLRIYSLVSLAGQSRRRFVSLGLAFAGGIVLFFLVLAAISAGLRLLGQGTIDINEQFKYPAARIAIAMILLALSANLWGLFNVIVPGRLAGLGQDSSSHGHGAAIGMGVMMAVLSTPCSFWLMALAVAWAQLQPLWLGSLAIVAIGVGMALPHAMLASFPDSVKLLPKPGAWMEYFKQTMGFLLIPAVLYLLSTLPPRGGWPWLVGSFGAVLVFGLWMWGSWVRFDAPLGRKLAVRGAAVLLAVAAGFWLLPQPVQAGVEFEPFGVMRIDHGREDGRIVVVKVTAAWCTECKILDYRVFARPEIARAFHGRKVVAVEADVTDKSSPASQWVKTNFGGAPPMTIIYPVPPGPPRVVVGVFGPDEMMRYLDEAAASRAPAGATARSRPLGPLTGG
jgi:thiol:disulfide interchange protein DsbD